MPPIPLRKKLPQRPEKRLREKGEEVSCDEALLAALQKLKKGDILNVNGLGIKEGETSPPKRYNSGSMILAMENAGQLIEDEDLRSQIKGSGIGTSATRAEILKKLFNIKYLSLNKKTQVITPTLQGEMIYDVVNCSIRQLLESGADSQLGKGSYLCGRGIHYGTGVHGQAGAFCAPSHQAGGGQQLPVCTAPVF